MAGLETPQSSTQWRQPFMVGLLPCRWCSRGPQVPGAWWCPLVTPSDACQRVEHVRTRTPLLDETHLRMYDSQIPTQYHAVMLLSYYPVMTSFLERQAEEYKRHTRQKHKLTTTLRFQENIRNYKTVPKKYLPPSFLEIPSTQHLPLHSDVT